MNSYLAFVPQYLAAHKKRTKLVVTGVAVAVALVTGIFSMLDAGLQYEKIQIIHEYGNYHLGLKAPTDEEKRTIAGRIDVQNTGTWVSFKNGSLNGKECRLAALDEHFAPNMNVALVEGRYPAASNEIMLEVWAAESLQLKVGDTAQLTFAGNIEKECLLSGIYSDYSHTKAQAMPGVFLSIAGAAEVQAEKATACSSSLKTASTLTRRKRPSEAACS